MIQAYFCPREIVCSFVWALVWLQRGYFSVGNNGDFFFDCNSVFRLEAIEFFFSIATRVTTDIFFTHVIGGQK
jgi:hypothetical protein